MFWLSKRNLMRYGKLKRSIKGITHKMLSSQLKELAADDIIIRTKYKQVPPKVEYFLLKRIVSYANFRRNVFMGTFTL